MGRVLDEANNKVQEAMGHPIVGADEYVEECAHPITQQELRWLKSLTAALSRSERDAQVLRSLAKASVE
jgi:hypothetical protein